MKHITKALIFLALLCLTAQGVESRPSGATEDPRSEERLKRQLGAQIKEATFHQGDHNFGTETHTYLTSQNNYVNKEGAPKETTSTILQTSSIVSQNHEDIKEKYIEKCTYIPISPALPSPRNKRSPGFNYAGSTQNYHSTYHGGHHNFGKKETHYQVQPTDIDYNVQPQDTTSPDVKTTDQKLFTKECHFEKTSSLEQEPIDNTKIRQKRGFDYSGSTAHYAGGANHVQTEGATPNWNNQQHYQGNHIQNSNEYVQPPNTFRQPPPQYPQHRSQNQNYQPIHQQHTNQFNQAIRY